MNLENILKKIFGGADAAEQPLIQGQPGPSVFPISPMLVFVKGSDVNDMVKLLGPHAIGHWLRHRRAAADRFHPDWQSHPTHERVGILDDCARFAATLN